VAASSPNRFHYRPLLLPEPVPLAIFGNDAGVLQPFCHFEAINIEPCVVTPTRPHVDNLDTVPVSNDTSKHPPEADREKAPEQGEE
jgi:hypothetical protein